MTELDSARVELRKLRERVEVLSRKNELLEKRILSTIPERDIPVATIGFVGDWPVRDRFEVESTKENPAIAGWVAGGPHSTLQPYPGHACLSLYDAQPVATGFSAIGLRGDRLAAFVNYIAEKQRLQRNFVPVFLTDSPEFHLFRRHGFVFEFIPPAPDRLRAAGRGSWEDRVADRTARFKQKWGLSELFDVSTASSASNVLPQTQPSQ